MDNNFNQQQVPQQQMPAQPVYGQAPQQQMPAQPAYGQAPAQQQMPAQPVYGQAPQPVYVQAPKQPPKFNTMELVALICSGVGLLMAIIGTLCYCSCSASATFESGSDGYTNSAVMIVAILGVLVAVVGVVFAILALKQKDVPVKAGKLAYVAAAVGIFAVLYGIIPTITICGYNCSLNNAYEDMENMDMSDIYNKYK